MKLIELESGTADLCLCFRIYGKQFFFLLKHLKVLIGTARACLSKIWTETFKTGYFATSLVGHVLVGLFRR